VPDDWHIIRDAWIAIEKLVTLAKNEDSGTQKTEKGYAENHPQSGKTGLLNHRQERHYSVSNQDVQFDSRCVVRTKSCLS